ncbi:ribosomal protein s21 protein [Pyrenophora tritici-repentis]|uniref:Ribosomal protein S21 n=2 Tax=Pyrenophora tritici-repentis TaxID=45151 RepID=A0A2W1EKN5_9PLEO|nr:uncharacterized protein PTRG_11240 [Pyrenophora tritici-repentis Pt-1C-BFP]KAA8622374.1 Ribosomal-S21 domain-containing protein [Pyrenophora tritici-repentis]EDU44290.1 hypothetical protein PTRG_11240 [Pyrenophora tritici-repentis Pt-1C-BFP]KAF7451358.1 hypothetical protein A1F99_031350 [Pyrenophora tritici-repentis]KAF7575536.1 Ribosomal-S21 domain containing protein [Pyrenophora tritici-repentis]KAG9385720.1 Ribosomal-S21 domain containing protein [Pyrenophora tritici-repentis]
MASRSLGELMLRPSTLTRIPYAQRITTPSWTCQRALSNTPQPSAQPAPKSDEEQFIPESEAQRPQGQYTPEFEAARPQPRPQASQAKDTRSLDSLFAGIPRDRAPPSYVPQGGTPNPQSKPRLFGAGTFASSNSMRPSRKPSLSFDDMDLPPDSILNPSLANKPSDAASLAVQQENIFAQYPRLNPAYGRSVDLDNSRGRDIVRGIGMLGSLMARNKVKRDFNKQRYHERGGLKRKRLASERWRARFMVGFKAVTHRVTQLTRKGW